MVSVYYSSTRSKNPVATLLQPPRGLEPKTNHVCITDPKRERVVDPLFDYHALLLPEQQQCALHLYFVCPLRYLPRPPANTSGTLAPPPKHLEDAYCGAGLFALILAPHITKITGLELSAVWVHFATRSSELNDSHTRSPS